MEAQISIHKEIQTKLELGKIKDMSTMVGRFYIAIQNPRDYQYADQIYENKDWINDFFGKNFYPKIESFINKVCQNHGSSSDQIFKDMGAHGKELEALKLMNDMNNYSKIHSGDSLNEGLAVWNIENGNLDNALEKIDKISNFHKRIILWGDVVKSTDEIEKPNFWIKLEKKLQDSVDKEKYISNSEIERMMDVLVKRAVDTNDVPQAKKLLTFIGECTQRVAETYEDMDTGTSYPRKEAFVTVGKGWARIGEMEKAKEWMKNGDLVEMADRVIALSLFDWGTVTAEEVIRRMETLERNESFDLSSYVWRAEKWLESREGSEKKAMWNWIKDNQNINKLIEKENTKISYVFDLYEMAQKMADSVAEKKYLNSLRNIIQYTPDPYIESIVELGLSQKSRKLGKYDEASRLINKAWNTFDIEKRKVDYSAGQISKIFDEFVLTENWEMLQSLLGQLQSVAEDQGTVGSARTNMLILKYEAKLFKHKYGDFGDQKIDFLKWGKEIENLGWSEGNGDLAATLIINIEDLNNFLNYLSDDEKIISRIYLSNISKKFHIESEIYGSISEKWVTKQLVNTIGSAGKSKREIVSASLAYISGSMSSNNRRDLINILTKHDDWWKSDNEDLKKDLTEVIAVVAGVRLYNDDDLEPLHDMAQKIISDSWDSDDPDLLNLAVGILGDYKTRNTHSEEWLTKWIVDHVDDFSIRNKDLAKNRFKFLEIGLDINIDKVNYLAYQMLGEGLFGNEQTIQILNKLSENRFLEYGMTLWLSDFLSEHDESANSKVIGEIQELIGQGVFPRREVLENFFSDLTIPFEVRLGDLKNEGKVDAESFREVFRRETATNLIENLSEDLRCVIGSVYGEPVFLVQNFVEYPAPVNGHHEILESWAKKAKTKGSPSDLVVQNYIGMLVDENDMAVEHFLRGFLNKDAKGNLILRSDAGFDQSSEGARAEIIPKIAETARRFGIDELQEIPDDEYGELQRIGFMRGVVKNYTKVIADNLGDNDANKFSKLAKRFFIDQEFDKNSRPYETLESYLGIIEYYRRGGK